jgi:hypothetical protein
VIYDWEQTSFLHWSRVRIRNAQGNVSGYKIIVRDLTGATIAVLAKESYSNNPSAMVYRYTGDVATCGVPSDGFLSVQEVYAPGNPYSPRAARIGLSLLVENKNTDPSEWVSRVMGRRNWYDSTGAPSASCCGGKMVISSSGSSQGTQNNPVLCDMNGGTVVNYLIQSCCYDGQSNVPKEGVPILMTTNYLPSASPYRRQIRNKDFEIVYEFANTNILMVSTVECQCGLMVALDKAWDVGEMQSWLDNVFSIYSTSVSSSRTCCGDALFYGVAYARGWMASISEQRAVDPSPLGVSIPNLTANSSQCTTTGCCCGGVRPFYRLPNTQLWVWDTVFGQMLFDYSDLSRIA